MNKRSVHEMIGTPINGEDVQGVTMKLLVGRDDQAPNFAMRHFSIEPDGFTPMHSHDWEHEVFVLAGRGELECDGSVRPIAKGDGVFIPSNQTHQFRTVGDEPLEFLCIVPVESNCGQVVAGS